MEIQASISPSLLNQISRKEVSKQINLLISNSNAYKSEEHALFIGYLGVTVRSRRSMVTMERSIVDHFKNVTAV